MKSAIIISITSDIAGAMALRWLGRGWRVFGTYRHVSARVRELQQRGAKLIRCDLEKHKSVKRACSKLGRESRPWDILVVSAGTQEPVGPFAACDFHEWEKSLRVNFTGQVEVIHQLLASRRREARPPAPLVLLFAGGGTNDAPVNYSAYIVSKIALIKMCELLGAEVSDTRFVIIGPGWVKTKIHQSTLRAAERAGANYQRTVDKLSGNACTPMDVVLDSCDWLISAPREVVSGRNFSTVYDKWGTKALEKELRRDPDMYKLRRHGNVNLLKANGHRWRKMAKT